MKFRFDTIFESSARRMASHASRRSFIARLGAVMVGVGALPLLPVVRNGRADDARKRDLSMGVEPRLIPVYAPADCRHLASTTTPSATTAL